MEKEKQEIEIKKGMIFYKNQLGRPYKHHIVAILKDEKPKPVVIHKYFGRRKQWWHYEVESIEILKYSLEIGYYYLKPSPKRKMEENQ